MRAQPSSPFDISPMLKMYMESIELRKKNYENFLKSAPLGAEGIDGHPILDFCARWPIATFGQEPRTAYLLCRTVPGN